MRRPFSHPRREESSALEQAATAIDGRGHISRRIKRNKKKKKHSEKGGVKM